MPENRKKPDWTGPGGTKMIPLSSSVIKEAGYDAKRRKLYIKFPGGEIYDFCNVPQAIFDNLLKASSPGTYYDKNIRGRYPCH
jgi:KTSC domain-containing protein